MTFITRIVTADRIGLIVQLMEQHPKTYGVDVVKMGVRDIFHQILKNSLNNPNVVFVETVDEEDRILCVISFYFAETLPVCLVRGAFLNVELRHIYHPVFLYRVTFDNCYELLGDRLKNIETLYWVQRVGRNRESLGFYSYITNEGYLKDYEVSDYEFIEPGNYAKDKLLGKYLLGPLDGCCTKPVVIKKLHKKSINTV